MKTLAIASATLALAFTASPALASSSDLPTKDVSYADLNLNTPQGQARLETRLESAARSVCRSHERRSGTRIRSPHLDACLANARASAKKQMAAVMADQRRGG
ncbi:UrcA family protein [uncultured Erythrobacter sp.]|uniref:UrcA family protein n=1 Tax=uncultured Erythrobacter sp. TaxID=263913 RepID=UPI00260810AB|nr:UrcA family protein [uncultured Erythrobacter sp.]